MTTATAKRYGYGWKFLTPWGTGLGNFAYTLPSHSQKWAEPTVHPEPAAPDGEGSGAGRLHVMDDINALYAPEHWWLWFVRYEMADIIGQSSEKHITAVRAMQLRRVRPEVLHRIIRFGYLRGADLHGANLCGANLCGADLRGANLRGADLHGADLQGANLVGTRLQVADLRGANLRGANLCGADLRGVDLRGVDLRGVDLRGVDLRGAKLHEADLHDADLRGTGGTRDHSPR